MNHVKENESQHDQIKNAANDLKKKAVMIGADLLWNIIIRDLRLKTVKFSFPGGKWKERNDVGDLIWDLSNQSMPAFDSSKESWLTRKESRYMVGT